MLSGMTAAPEFPVLAATLTGELDQAGRASSLPGKAKFYFNHLSVTDSHSATGALPSLGAAES